MNIENGNRRYHAGFAGFPATIRYLSVLFLLIVGSGTSYAQPSGVVTLTTADYIEMYQLYAAYSLALDTGNGPARVATFTPDGTMSSHLSNHVPYHMDRLLKMTNGFGQKKRPIGGHILTNIHFTPTAEGVDGTCYAILYSSKPDAAGNFRGMPAFYEDKLVKTPMGWRFKSREVFEAYEEVPTMESGKK